MSGRTIVVGAGLSGLAAAYALVRHGQEVLVLEASDRAGGVVRTQRKDGFLLEAGPNTVRPAPELWSLIEELGLADQVLLADPRSRRFVDFGGALYPVPMSPAQLIGSRLLSTRGKFRLLAEPLTPRGTDADESVRDFIARRLGAEIADRLVEPFVAGIFAGSAARLSASAAFPKLHRWEQEHGSLLAGAIAERVQSTPARVRTSRPLRGLVTFRDGLETLPQALARALGPRWKSGQAVRAIDPASGHWSVATDAETFRADRVILAAPAHPASLLVSAFAPEAGLALAAIPHPPLAVLHLSWEETSLARPLRGFGHLVVPGADRRILGAVWSSSLFPGRAPAGRALLTVFLGGTRDPRALELSDEELVATAARDLQSEGLVRGAPDPIQVTRWSHAIPQYERGHADRIGALARAERRFPGLRFVGNYRDGISVVDVIRAGTAAARLELGKGERGDATQ